MSKCTCGNGAGAAAGTLLGMSLDDSAETIPDSGLPEAAALTGGEPVRTVSAGGVNYTLLGTAHVSKQSADEVERLLAGGGFDAVAIELDPARHAAITNPSSWEDLDLFKVIREGKAGMLMVNLALGAFQQRLADQVGIEPGEEMRVAIRAANEVGLPLLLIDRDIGLTLRRVNAAIPWYRRLMLTSGLLTSVVSNEKIEPEEIEKLKEGDILDATFNEFAQSSKEMYVPLISERDEYMALKLQEQSGSGGRPRYRNVLVVIGAGHLKGLAGYLEASAPSVAERKARRTELEHIPPKGLLPKLLPWLIVAVILTGFVIGFLRGPELGWQVVGDWFLINGVLAGLGAILALGHPLTVLASAVGAPFTSLNPLIGVGFVAAAVQMWIRKPLVSDFTSLRRDVGSLKGWYNNRVGRVLLVFVLSTLGSVAATWVAGASIFVRLSGGDG